MKRFTTLVAILMCQISIFANTGWSGKVTQDINLDEFVSEKIQDMYIEKCQKLKNKELFFVPIVEVERINDESDYLGSYAPTYAVDIKVYSPRIFDYITQHITVEVLYNQLSQEISLNILDNKSLDCGN